MFASLSAVSWHDLGFLAVALAAGGIITGLLAGLLGVGGGAVIVPVLYEVFGFLGVDESLRMQLCVGTSLAIIVPTSMRSHSAHKARGSVVPGVLETWRIPAILGIIGGSAIAGFANGKVLQVAFVIIALMMATKALSGRADWRLADHLPGKPVMWGYGFFIGLASSLIGISGGGLSTMVLTLYGVPIRAAVATSAGIGMLIPIPGIIGFAIAGWPHMDELPPLSIGYISVIGFLFMAPISSLVAPFGARIAHALPQRGLEIGFGIFLLLMAGRFLIASL
ncbi:sulfite exporter TauE/SafE family protein [Aquabacter sp. P-9]|uniref:sulfite exporter TauE/SafE family protein n=1 Tax=Aquabacter sediminis TaxID=3029197 RepID=UPI00237DD23E|nr:sulfite exporter TauE/SafE family protein [Aquabacter sp. P-9]MDE1570321.1 sulfite exporter TauE/SafE family protein [Aquabacter sp. P-9]